MSKKLILQAFKLGNATSHTYIAQIKVGELKEIHAEKLCKVIPGFVAALEVTKAHEIKWTEVEMKFKRKNFSGYGFLEIDIAEDMNLTLPNEDPDTIVEFIITLV